MANPKRVRIYYNDIDVAKRQIKKGCKFDVLQEKYAFEYAEEKIKNGSWASYSIPQLMNWKFTKN
jgi:hypothetical protein